MKKIIILSCFFISLSIASACNRKNNEKRKELVTIKQEAIIPADIYKTNLGDLKVTLVGHASIMFELGGKVIHVDPYSNVADYSGLPKADLILITHEHSDHLDKVALKHILKSETKIITTEVCKEILQDGDVLKIGEQTSFEGVSIAAVAAYNIVHKNSNGEHYHPKGRGNGYVMKFGNLTVYIAGDTENIPEMNDLRGKIDIAFLPKNLPYTMSDDMFIDAALRVTPKYLYPYHLSEFDLEKISKQIQNNAIELVIRPMSNK